MLKEVPFLTDTFFFFPHAPASDIKQQTLEHGMKTLREDGWDKVLGGVTTIDEILRVTEENDFEE